MSSENEMDWGLTVFDAGQLGVKSTGSGVASEARRAGWISAPCSDFFFPSRVLLGR